MKSLEQRVKEAEEKLKQLKTRQQMTEARQRAAMAKKLRADDTRRKVLVGAMFLERMGKDQDAKSKVVLQLNHWLTRPDDRALFGLQPLAAPAPNLAPVIERNGS